MIKSKEEYKFKKAMYERFRPKTMYGKFLSTISGGMSFYYEQEEELRKYEESRIMEEEDGN